MYNAVPLRRRQVTGFVFAVVLSVFTSMSKVLVPGTVFDQLQHDLGLDAHTLARFSSCYMYTYALAQLVVGMLASSLGGMRVLLLGGFSFCTGMLAFPLLSSPGWMLLARVLAGFGAGITFIGVANLTLELYSDRFTTVLGFAMVVGYLGPILGLSPMVALVQLTGWRIALLVPAVLATAMFAGVIGCTRGILPPVTSRPQFIRPLRETMFHLEMLTLCLASAILFGIYYAVQTVMGRKCLQDLFGVSPANSALLLTILAVIVAVMNFFAGAISRLFGQRLRILMPIMSLLGLAGAVLGALAIRGNWPASAMGTAFFLFCIPAGCFPLYCTIGKDSSPAKYGALAVALVNCWAFVLIALTGNLAGWIMDSHSAAAVQVGEVLIYPAAAYQGVFMLFIVTGALSFGAALLLQMPRRGAN